MTPREKRIPRQAPGKFPSSRPMGVIRNGAKTTGASPHFSHSWRRTRQSVVARREHKVVLGFSPNGPPSGLKPRTTFRRRPPSVPLCEKCGLVDEQNGGPSVAPAFGLRAARRRFSLASALTLKFTVAPQCNPAPCVRAAHSAIPPIAPPQSQSGVKPAVQSLAAITRREALAANLPLDSHSITPECPHHVAGCWLFQETACRRRVRCSMNMLQHLAVSGWAR